MFLKGFTRYFGVLPKQPKLELTMRTPYRTIFKSFTGFTRVYLTVPGEGYCGIGTNGYPRIACLPAGHIQVKNYTKGAGSFAKADSGEFVHSGGWAIMNDNNTIDINLFECIEKELFKYDKLDQNAITSDGSIGGQYERRLQDLALKAMARKV